MAYAPPAPPYYGPPAHSSGNGNKPINRIVIHCTAGSDGKGAQGTARYFKTKAAGGSAHYIIDSDETLQTAYDSVVCWHAPPNTHSLGLEMECSLANEGKGHWTRPDHVSMMKRTAVLTAQLCLAYDVPVVKLTAAQLRAGSRGICGHFDVSQAFGQSSHWDPGPYFPWAQFMAWVRAEVDRIKVSAPTPPKPPAFDPKELLDMNLDDVVIAATATTPAVDVRTCLAKAYWLAIEHGSGKTFRKVHDNWAPGGDLNNQLDRIEADTDVPKV